MIYTFLYLGFFGGYFLREAPVHVAIRAYVGVALSMFLVLFVGLRDDVGHDFFEYKYLFDTLRPLWEYSGFGEILAHSSKYHGEVGFDFIIILTKTLGLDFNGLLIVVSTSLLLILQKVTRYHQIDFFKALFVFVGLYFVYYFFSYLRLSIVAVGFLWALRFVIEKRFLRYLSVILFLSLFHVSALGLIVVYFFRIKLTLLSSLLTVGSAFLWQNFDSISYANTFFLNYHLLPGLNYYLTSTGDLHRQGVLTFTPVFHFFFYFINLYIYRSYLESDKLVDTLLRSYLLGIFILIAFIDFTLISSRISGILMLPIVILFPKVLGQLRGTYIRLGYFFILIFYSSMLFIKMIYIDPNYMLPYESIL